jgi:hypothetical protein
MTAFLDDYFPSNAEVQTETLRTPRDILCFSTTEPEGPSRSLSPASSLAQYKIVVMVNEKSFFVYGESSVEDYPELLVRLDKPTPGVAHLFPMPMGGQVLLSIRFYLYGNQATAAVARDEPVWYAWIDQRFPPQ